MTYTGKEIIEAMLAAYRLATSHRVPAAIIITGKGLKAVTRPADGDTVLIRDITPPAYNQDAYDAARQAFQEFTDAKPALERVLDIIDKDGAGKPRCSRFKAEVLAAFLNYYEMDEDAERVVKGNIYSPRPPALSLWTRVLDLIWR